MGIMTFSAIYGDTAHSYATHSHATHSDTAQTYATQTYTTNTYQTRACTMDAYSVHDNTPHAHTVEQSRIVDQLRLARQSSTATASKTILVDGLEVHIIRKPIKRLYLRVKPPAGEIVVTAPNRVPQRDIVALVRERKDWIARARQHVSSPASQQAQQPWSQERIDQAHAILNQRIPPLLRHWVPIIGKSPTALTLRRMKTRWGSCTPATGRIRINLELAYLPEQYLEYVLVHELAHLWERGHGAGFQRRMTQYLPQWKQLRSQLNNIVLR